MRLPILMLLLLAACTPAVADYAAHPRAAELTRLLASEYGFSQAELDRVRAALATAQQVPALIQAEQTAKEKTLTWTRYRPIHVNTTNIERGAAFVRAHAELLERARARWGVPPEIIAAILGVETRYGSYTGPHRVLDSLARQGFDHPTRHRFFFRELAEFFALCRDLGIDPGTPKGSYAGAMGMAQFMPSNYRRLAVDFDGDGRVDLWSVADAIGSIANYLVHYRPSVAWQPGEPVAVPAVVAGSPDTTPNPSRPDSTLRALERAGVRPAIPLGDRDDAAAAHLVLALDEGSEHWIGFRNFYALMSYNPRVFYAMSVWQLAQAIAVAAAEPPPGA